ncbi:MAG: regulatory iron-sulfur-containing complex subunit RicT [Eubacteriales bacterium]|nr:regulatory iron-sulfur-containing complex subunit RicT [Eubacteriales bacterium]
MIDVVSIKFKSRGKSYFFDPGNLQICSGDKVIVETSKGLEIADCCCGNHWVEETSVVQPLRPVIRLATREDLAVDEANRKREVEAFEICQKKIVEHGLDMKLVEVECSFEGSKILFFFTSDGRVDFRELVKDLASIFRSRIELRQIGVRDEAKMIGGIAICGRPYCCNQFLDAFQPVSTKMAKVQSLSLNPTKISGSCGRLMCCLRYEQDAYEDLLKNVPKQGAFVQTKDGYGTAMQVNLLRQTVKVKLDSDTDDTLRLYRSDELATVPGGRPKEGERPANVFTYVPPVEESDDPEQFDTWEEPAPVRESDTVEVPVSKVRDPSRQKRRGKSGRDDRSAKPEKEPEEVKLPAKTVRSEKGEGAENADRRERPYRRNKSHRRPGIAEESKKQSAEKAVPEAHKAAVKPVKAESAEKGTEKSGDKPFRPKNHRRYYHGKPHSNDNK